MSEKDINMVFGWELKKLVKCGTLTALVLAEFSVRYPKNMESSPFGGFYREHQSSISGSHPEYRLRAPYRVLPKHHLQASAELTIGTSQSQYMLTAYILTTLCRLGDSYR